MAGRPGTGGSTGILIGMIVSVAVAAIMAVLLIILWTDQERLRAEADKANNQLNRVLRSNEMQGPLKLWYDQASDRNSVAKLMNSEVLSLAQLISSEVSSGAPGIAERLRDEQLQPLWDSISQDAQDGVLEDATEVVGRPLLDAFSALYRLYGTERQARQQDQATMTELNNQIAELVRSNNELQTAFDQKTQELQAKVDAMEGEWTTFSSNKEAEFTEIAASNRARADEQRQNQQTIRQDLDGLRTRLASQEARNRELQAKIKEFQILPQPLTTLRKADGTVLRAKPGDESVFIDLGRDDHLTLGLRFAVYPPDPGIPSSGVAKAAIEVVRIGEVVSECRIKNMNPLFPIIEGDLVANPVYDRDRQLTFYVLGEFDLDHDGRDDPNGKSNVEAVIKDFGGVVGSELSTRTDFVVVGARPYVAPLPNDPSDEDRVVAEDHLRQARLFDNTIQEALSLSVPVLTQETFLNFLGRF